MEIEKLLKPKLPAWWNSTLIAYIFLTSLLLRPPSDTASGIT